MGKKFIGLLLGVILIFSFSACNDKTVDTSNSISATNSRTYPSATNSKENSTNKSVENNNTSSVKSNDSGIKSQANSSKINSSETSKDASASKDDKEEIETPVQNLNTIYHSPQNSNANYKLVETVYETYDTVVVDAVVTDYGADPTGVNDSTNAIKSAISYVQSLGGGTVYLPVGKYLVTDTISVPQYVALRGDWQCPDVEKPAYGTVIVAKPSELGSSKPQDKPLIALSGHSGIDGLTFYYPNQNLNKKYGYTVYADAPVTTTIKNVTMINSSYGIGVSLNSQYNELVNIENLYGTFLYNAISHNATTDVGFYNNINIKNDYFLQNTLGEKPNESTLKTFTRQNLSALVLGDLDDQLISNVTVNDAKYGFYFTTGIRQDAGFWGLVNNAVLDCETGVFADYLNSRSGVVFTSSNLGKVINNSPVGAVKIAGTQATLSGSGINITESGSVDLSKYNLNINPTFNKTTKLYVAEGLSSGGQTDNSQKLNEILSSLPSDGCVLLIPNGIYRLNSAITIPKNVEIRSTQGVFSRTNQSQNGKNGVVFVTYVSGATFKLNQNAGVRGVRIWHAKNDFKTAESQLKNSTYSTDISVKADGDGAYAFLNETVGAFVGFDFSNCDNHILKSNYGISYKNFIVAGGNNGKIVSCLSNPNFMTRSNLYDYFDKASCLVDNWKLIRNSGESNEDFATLRDGIGRTYTTMVKLVNADGERCQNVFCYGEAGLFDIQNSNDVLLVNTSLDYIPNDKCVYTLNGGSCVIVGSLRVYGMSIGYKSGSLKAYGRIAFGVIKEVAFDSTISTEDKIEYVTENARSMSLFDCDTKPSGFNLTLNTNKTYVSSGSASWKFNGSDTKTISGTFTAKNVSEYSKGYLHLKIYATTSNIGIGQIEISSSGGCDVNEMNWSFDQAVTKQGWNDIYLAIPSGGSTGGSIDLTKVNYIRIYVQNGTSDYYVDDISFITD